MSGAIDLIRSRRDLDSAGNIKRGIESYLFIDYGIVTAYKDGLVNVTLAKKVMKQEINLTNVEVLNHGSLGLMTVHELKQGDIVQVMSSRSFINTLDEFTAAITTSVPAYDVSTIKAVPLAINSPKALTVHDDGSFDLVSDKLTMTWDNSNFSIEISDGILKLNGDSKDLILHDLMTTAMNNFRASIESAIAGAITGHTHISASSGSPTGPGSGTVPPITVDISGTKATKIKTG